MSSKDIEKKYLKLLKEIQRYNEFYYDKNSPIVSDQEYDKIKEEILKIEKNNKLLINNLSPSKTVGFKPSKNFIKSKHRVQMLSLSNAFNKEDLHNFEKKIFNYINEKIKFDYSVEPKIDGISASLTYKKGFFQSGVSRGDGITGELITGNLNQ